MENKARTNKHWLIVLIACGMAGSSLGINMNVMGVFFQPVAEDLGILTGSFAFHSTLAAFSLSFISLFIPRILEHISFKKMILFGSIMASLSSIAMAFTTQVWLFYILGTLRGIGSGLFAIIPYTILINQWFDKKNGLMLSVVSSFAGVVGVVMSPVFTWTINQFGWEMSFIFVGVFLAVFSLPAAFIKYELNPKDEGLLPYGSEEDIDSEEVTDAETNSLSKKQVSYASLPFIVLSLVAILFTYSSGLIQNLPGYATTIALGSTFGATMLSAAMLGNIVFKIFLGTIEEKIGPANTVLISMGLTLIAVLSIMSFRNPIVLLVASFIFGAMFYVPAVGLAVMTNYFFGKESSNRVYPTLSFLAGVGGSVSMSLVGFVYDFTGSYMPAFWLSIILVVICGALIASAKFSSKKVAA